MLLGGSALRSYSFSQIIDLEHFVLPHRVCLSLVPQYSLASSPPLPLTQLHRT